MVVEGLPLAIRGGWRQHVPNPTPGSDIIGFADLGGAVGKGLEQIRSKPGFRSTSQLFIRRAAVAARGPVRWRSGRSEGVGVIGGPYRRDPVAPVGRRVGVEQAVHQPGDFVARQRHVARRPADDLAGRATHRRRDVDDRPGFADDGSPMRSDELAVCERLRADGVDDGVHVACGGATTGQGGQSSTWIGCKRWCRRRRRRRPESARSTGRTSFATASK